MSELRDRIIAAGTGWCAHTHQHDNSKAAITAADEALTILAERITEKFTPALNTGTAMDAFVIVGAAIREVRAEIGSVSDSSEAKRTLDRAGAQRETTDSQPAERVRWELSPVTADSLQAEFDQRIKVAIPYNDVANSLASNTLRDILAELTPRPKEGK